jgi:hypothetical protein
MFRCILLLEGQHNLGSITGNRSIGLELSPWVEISTFHYPEIRA